MRAVPGQLDQRALASRIRAGDRPRREQIAGPERCAVHGRVRQLLRHRPVERAGVRPRDDRSGQLDLELDVEPPVRGHAQVGERLRILCRRRHESVLQERERRDPRRDGGRERLSEEGTERLVLPRLDVARAPVVDEHDSEHVLAEVGGRNRHPERAADADDEPELELDVEPSTRPEARLRIVGPFRLAAGPDDRCSSDDDGARTAVIADRKVAPVRQQRIRIRAEEASEVRGVLERRVEVDVVADPEREVHGRLVERNDLVAALDQLRDTAERSLPGRLPAARNAFRLGWEKTASRPLAARSRIPPPTRKPTRGSSPSSEKTPKPTAPFTAAASRAARAPRPARRSCSCRSSAVARVEPGRARQDAHGVLATRSLQRRARTPQGRTPRARPPRHRRRRRRGDSGSRARRCSPARGGGRPWP